MRLLTVRSLRGSSNSEHVDAGLARGQLEALRERLGDGLAVEGGVVMHRVRIFGENALETSLTTLR